MTLFLIALLVAALLTPPAILALGRRQRRAALARFGQRVTARRTLIQADISRVTHDQGFRGFDRLRLLSGLQAERTALDLHVLQVEMGQINPDAPLGARPRYQWRPSPTDTTLACSHDTMREREPLETACRTLAKDMTRECA